MQKQDEYRLKLLAGAFFFGVLIGVCWVAGFHYFFFLWLVWVVVALLVNLFY